MQNKTIVYRKCYGKPEELTPCYFRYYPSKDVEILELPDSELLNFEITKRGCMLSFSLDKDTMIYGFGLQLYSFNHRGKKLVLRVNSDPISDTGDSHAPVPFFVTNKGYGIFLDTARTVEAYCGYAKKHKRNTNAKQTEIKTNTDELYNVRESESNEIMTLEMLSSKGVTVYIFKGETITDIVSAYNKFSGGGCDVPDWALGSVYRCYAKSDMNNIIKMADYLSEHNLPFSVLGLEPGWQTQSYSCSYVWDNERFPDPKGMIDTLKKHGYHINLWEHAFVHPTSPLYDALYEYSSDYEVWQGLVPDFSLPEARTEFAAYHRDSLVSLGIDGFKLDECDSSDYTRDWSFPNCAKFPSGMDGEQYHSMFGTLYMQAILESLGKTQTLSAVRNAGALASPYPFVLYSDLYEHKAFIRGVVNSGFSGLLWAPEVREGASKEDFIRRLQTAVFSVQCLINAWYYEEFPWIELDCEEEVRALLYERKKLEPKLIKAFANYRDNGIPPVRALVMDYTNDPETYEIDDQYLFCDDMLVAPMVAGQTERKVYLPDGNWKDYWTGNTVNSGWSVFSGDNIPVFVKC